MACEYSVYEDFQAKADGLARLVEADILTRSEARTLLRVNFEYEDEEKWTWQEIIDLFVDDNI